MSQTPAVDPPFCLKTPFKHDESHPIHKINEVTLSGRSCGYLISDSLTHKPGKGNSVASTEQCVVL